MAISEKKTFQFKGSLFTLTVMQLLNSELLLLDQQLEETIKKAPKFFQNAPIIIDLKLVDENKDPIDFHALKSTLHKHNLIPVAVRGGKESDHQAAASCGFAVLNSYKSNETSLDDTIPATSSVDDTISATSENDTNSATSSGQSSTMLITTPIRSGQQVYAKEGDLIVLSQVSQGAEILADGNIHIYGALRGRVLAGIHGNQKARIFCNYMDAELISIAGFYLVAENLKQHDQKSRQMIYLESGQLKFVDYST